MSNNKYAWMPNCRCEINLVWKEHLKTDERVNIMRNKKKQLKWGETPFHKMDHATLLMSAIKMYWSLNSCSGEVKKLKEMNKIFGREEKPNLYFEKGGSGFNALYMADQALDPINREYESEDVYRSYYRYAIDLLFPECTSGLVVCPVCGQMFGAYGDGRTDEGKVCGQKFKVRFSTGCPGVFRKLTWKDMEIKDDKKDNPDPV